MWPFTRRRTDDTHAVCEDTVIARKLKSNCKNIESSLNSCLKANRTHPERCQGLRSQLVHCQANVLCPEVAKLYDQCMLIEVNRAVRTHDSVDQNACSNVLDKMERCLSSPKNRKHLAGVK